MDAVRKLGCGIILGGCLLIVGTYASGLIFGDSPLTSHVFLAGWIIIMLLIFKYFSLLKRNSKAKSKRESPW